MASNFYKIKILFIRILFPFFFSRILFYSF